MYLISTKALPVDQWLAGKSPSLKKIVDNCRQHPMHFLAEAFGLGLMIVGTLTVASWAYELGRTVGFAIG